MMKTPTTNKTRLHFLMSAAVSCLMLPAFAQTYSFTNAAATGKNGPSQGQVNTAYSSTNLNGLVTVTGNGIQQWTVPSTGSYRIVAAGAKGGSTNFSAGGTGITVSCDVMLTAGTVLNIVVGQEGTYNNSTSNYVASGSGGGGSFVYTGAIGGGGLIAAAGGGGGGLSSPDAIVAGNVSNGGFGPNGYTITDAGGYVSAGGTGGNGGGFSNRTYLAGGPGAGWLSDYNPAYANNLVIGGTRFTGGSINGLGTEGGFGGGGASGESNTTYISNYSWSGGGGGYSGGGGGHNGGSGDGQVGGGGGSYLTGTNQINVGANNGMGYVNIINLYSANITVASAILCNGDANGSLTATPSGGSGPYTYAWSPTGGTSATATGLAAGSYTCVITDATMATASATFVLTEPAALTASGMQTNVSCNAGTNGDAMVSPTGGTPAYTYAWSSGGTGATESNLVAGSYTCTIVDANGCSTSNTFAITEPTAIANNPTQTNVLCNGQNNGSATVAPSGGVSPYTYSWSSGGTAATESNLVAGSYTCTITDANSCTSVEIFSITEPAAINVTTVETHVSCFGGSNGAIDLTATGGVAPYTFDWNSGAYTTEDLVSIPAGTYTGVLTDANGCTSSGVITITEPPVLLATTVDTAVTCNGGSNGSIMVIPTGGTAPYTYMWLPNVASGPYANNLVAGSYICDVTDTNGCMYQVSVSITEPAAITASFSTQATTTCGGSDGAIDLSTVGGMGTLSYLWSNSATTEDISGVAAGTYSVTITDSTGCMSTANATVSDPAGPTVTLGITTSTMCFDDGSLTLSGGSPAGGTWTGPGVTGGMFDPSTAGNGMQTITYTYTDANNCTSSAVDSINVDPCAGVIENNTGAISVYPNPTSGMFTVTSESGATIIVYNALGEIVSSTVALTTKSQLNLSGFAEGMYFVVVEQNNSRSTEQIILSK